MMLYPLNGVSAEGRSQVLWKDGGAESTGDEGNSNLTKEGANRSGLRRRLAPPLARARERSYLSRD
jgi:hypothetical protein